jgi:hypothetical protein
MRGIPCGASHAYTFEVICPVTLETEALIAPRVDKNIMTYHLK